MNAKNKMIQFGKWFVNPEKVDAVTGVVWESVVGKDGKPSNTAVCVAIVNGVELRVPVADPGARRPKELALFNKVVCGEDPE